MPATKKAAKKAAPKKSAVSSTKKTAKKTVKKVAKKAAKKTSSAKVVTTKAAPCACACVVRDEEAFWIHNGPVVHSVAELIVVLGEITDEQFAYHTKRAGNDFARWLRDCLGDEHTAARIEKARGRGGAARALSCSSE